MSMNLFVASGNIGKDIEIRFTPNNKCIGTFSLPVKQGWGDNEKTSWVNCKIFGERAQKLQQYLTKGTKVTVQGEFVLEEWESNGQKNSRPCIIVDNIDLGQKPQQQNNNYQQQQAPQQGYQQPQQQGYQQPPQQAYNP